MPNIAYPPVSLIFKGQGQGASPSGRPHCPWRWWSQRQCRWVLDRWYLAKWSGVFTNTS